ncbi:phage tail assembly chaperone [Paraburkholderia sp. BR10923]|uniref:phage tail assembly chaperone n=1 Tax=Paraburkholderia sp. BR10923 TaxID=3236992 RepID=UPI0034CE1D38
MHQVLTMRVYSYHPQTGAYVGAEEADEDPMNPGQYLIPAHATTKAPPVGGFVCFDEQTGEWRIDETHTREVAMREVAQELSIVGSLIDEQADLVAASLPGADADYLLRLRVYRVKLRELPRRAGFPNVEWPTLPGKEA